MSAPNCWLGADLLKNCADITDQVEIKGLDLLNFDSDFGDARTLFGPTKPPTLLRGGKTTDKREWVESDVDMQLMLLIPFISALGINGIQITSLPPETSDGDDEIPMRPKSIRLYKNVPNNIGFDAADDFDATQTIEISPQDWNEKTGTVSIELRAVAFRNVTSLVIFIEDGDGDGEKTRLDRIRIIGKSGAERNPGKLKKMGPTEPQSNTAVIFTSDDDIETYNRSLQLAGIGDVKGATRAIERAEELVLEDPPNEELAAGVAPVQNTLCTYCATAEKSWRVPRVGEIFNPLFNSRMLKTPDAQHHDSIADLKECMATQKCSLCKLVYAAIVGSASKTLRQLKPREKDENVFTVSGQFIDDTAQPAHGMINPEDVPLEKSALQFVFGRVNEASSAGDEPAVTVSKEVEDIIELLEGEIVISLMSSDWNSSKGPSLQIRIGESFYTHLDISPIEDEIGNLIADCSDIEDSSTISDVSFRIASAWLENCLSSHPKCSAYHSGIPELPTRVIDVGPSDGSEEPYLYVREDGQRDRYLTLSHRWGSSTSLEATKTMKANRTLNTTTIPFSSLPLTFQHAIIITRRFGYRYLWIDSLCIIQDDEDDWMVESEKMGEIYRKADFTIATIDAMSADSGCFFPRDGQTLRPCRLDIYRPPRQEDTYASHTGKIFASRVVGFDSSRAGYGRTSSLDSRGWCLQERVLSTRTLSYSKYGLFWECVTTEATEMVPYGIDEDDTDGAYEYMRHLRKQVGAIALTSRYGKERSDTHNAWHLLVQDYSRRNLTKESDKLIALKGIINSLSDAKDDICYAGVWKKHLWRDLSWLVVTQTTVIKLTHKGNVPSGGRKGRRLASSIAPTWSWASVEGHVCFLMDGSYSTLSDISFGQELPKSSGPVITATGSLVKVRTCSCGGTCDPDYVKKEKKDMIHYFLEDKIEHLLDAGTKKRVADWYPDDGNASHALAWSLPIGEYFGYVLCLTLVPVDGFGANHYQRIGLAVWSSGDWKASCASRISILQGMPDQAPPHRYFVGASDDGTELVRTIYIV